MKYILGSGFSDGTYETKGYVSHGCWKFANLKTLEGRAQILDGHYKNRSNAVHKCFVASKTNYKTVFAVSDGGSCQGKISYGQSEYMKRGRSTKCAKDGRGGPDASEIYLRISK